MNGECLLLCLELSKDGEEAANIIVKRYWDAKRIMENIHESTIAKNIYCSIMKVKHKFCTHPVNSSITAFPSL